LDSAAASRVARWALDRFGGSGIRRDDKEPLRREPTSFKDLPSFFAALNPPDDDSKVLVIAYWLHVREDTTKVTSFAINKRLKDLGHGVRDITLPMGRLATQKPSLVVQMQKAGTSQQARKSYKITDAGIRAVEKMATSAA